LKSQATGTWSTTRLGL